jgi:hypothetical protein
MKVQQIPQIDSIDALARFWDTHDLTEFEDYLEEVPETVFERKRETFVRVPLRPREIEAVQHVAKARGVAQVVLLREWLREKLQESANSGYSGRAGKRSTTVRER